MKPPAAAAIILVAGLSTMAQAAETGTLTLTRRHLGGVLRKATAPIFQTHHSFSIKELNTMVRATLRYSEPAILDNPSRL
jgi:hypothetical protein